MRRAVAVAALVLLSFLTTQVWAQARGGGFRGGVSAGSRPAPRANFVVRSQVPSRNFNGGFGVGVGLRPLHYHHHYPVVYSYGYGYPYGYGYYPYYGVGFYDPSFYGGYYSSYDNSGYSQQTQQLSNQISSLDYDIHQLREENDELRDYIARRDEPAPYPDRSIPPSVAQPLQPQGRIAEPQRQPEGPATVLVYKDGRKLETRNYAIVGDTLWALSDKRATKIPLSELDLDKTTQENEQRGVEFTGPATAPR